MPSRNDPKKLKGPSPVRSEHVEDRSIRTGPGGLTMRQIHEQVKLSTQRDRDAHKTRNALLQKQNRWQRFVRYVWDRKPK